MVENPGINLTSEVSVPQEDNRYFSFNLFWLKTGVKSRNLLVKKLALNRRDIYKYPKEKVSVSRYWTEGTTALNCKKEGQKDLQSHRYSEQMLDCMFFSDHRN